MKWFHYVEEIDEGAVAKISYHYNQRQEKKQ
jgi:hypothetical protein